MTREPRSRVFPISDWDSLTRELADLFRGLGEVLVDESAFRFRSRPPAVATGLELRRDGRVLGSMPLHEIELHAVTVTIVPSLDEIRLDGPSASYRYRVPPQLRRHAESDAS